MMNRRFLLLLCLCFSVTIGSFADEATQIVFALRLASDASAVSMLLSAGLLGGLLAGPLAPNILARLGPLNTIPSIFVVQAVLVAAASLTNHLLAYIVVAVALGCTGSLFLSAMMVAIPAVAQNERQIDRLNRANQTVRNLGYVGGPALGGALYASADGTGSLLAVSAFVLLATPVTIGCFRLLNLRNERLEPSLSDKGRTSFDLAGLLRTPGVARAVAPLALTITLTSALNVLLIVRVRNELQFSAETYGIIVSTLSVGLIIGPLVLSPVLGRIGDAAGASVAAAMIGLGLVFLSGAASMWTMMAATLLIGGANGAQNTLMSNFMMKSIKSDKRVRQMPAYITILQSAVLIGFTAAAYVPPNYAAVALMISGAATIMAGIGGAISNLNNRTDLYAKGAN